eukprot:GHVS01052811.1.p1 GENE.GHVS01052811.1~~GHVS01052811.1.p1  ORF type:complete len:137 (-),score=21.51 GHVS01052811.1:399-809(-)
MCASSNLQKCYYIIEYRKMASTSSPCFARLEICILLVVVAVVVTFFLSLDVVCQLLPSCCLSAATIMLFVSCYHHVVCQLLPSCCLAAATIMLLGRSVVAIRLVDYTHMASRIYRRAPSEGPASPRDDSASLTAVS